MVKYFAVILIKIICLGIFFTIFLTTASAQVANKTNKSPSTRPVKKDKSNKCVKNKKKTNSKPIMKKNSVDKTNVSTKTNPKQDDCETQAKETKDEVEIKPSNEECQSPKQSDNNQKPTVSEAKGAGTFDGDLRDLPNTKTVKQENPNREPPKTKPVQKKRTDCETQKTKPKVLPKNRIIKP